MKIHAVFALLGAVLCLYACSGGPETGGAPPTGLRAPTALLHLMVTIPNPSAVSTKSVAVSTGTNMLGVFDTTAQSNGCVTLNGATVCTFLLHVPMGRLVLRITGFDQTAGSGRTMCTGNLMVGTIPMSPGTIRVILGGVVNGISIDIPDAGPAGTAENVPVVVMAKDAEGNVILGPERYSTPITVTDDDKTGSTALSLNNAAPTSVVHVASASDAVDLIYNGGDVTAATIDA
ncbi:MAG TPA: hypothetical protein VFE17_02950, partial [Candidatus Baltobacteraceae bacterium]|nr:hypothetical protein [Candidatus Baltobacteraceae bacterium]